MIAPQRAWLWFFLRIAFVLAFAAVCVAYMGPYSGSLAGLFGIMLFGNVGERVVSWATSAAKPRQPPTSPPLS